jgi:hypothetical protein
VTHAKVAELVVTVDSLSLGDKARIGELVGHDDLVTTARPNRMSSWTSTNAMTKEP